MKSYEVYTYRDGAWKFHAGFRDRDEAIGEARALDRAGRYAGISVVEETWDAVEGRATGRTIFRDNAFNRANEERLAQSRRDRSQVDSAQRERRAIEVGRRMSRLRRLYWVEVARTVALMTLLGLAGIGGLVALQYLESLF